jgi:hypothetical protein
MEVALMVSNLTLPTPDPTDDVWGEALNTAIEAVNTDLETTKTSVTTVSNRVTTVENTLGDKADADAVASALALKADDSDLAAKADKSVVDPLVIAVADKADTSDVTAGFDTVNGSINELAAEVDLKADSSALALKADITTVDLALSLKADVDDIAPSPVFLEHGDLIPAGTPAETVIYHVPQRSYEDVKVTHVSANQGTAISNFDLPDDLAIGDVVLAIAVTIGAGRSFAWAAPWTEIFDYSQSRTISAAIYRISDQAALDDIVVPVITPQGNFDQMVLATMKIEAQALTAWPAFSSGGGRSAATIVSPTNSSFGVNTISSSPFASFDTEYIFGAAYSGIPAGPAPVLTLPAAYEEVFDETTGGLRFIMGKRPMAVVPISAQTIAVQHVTGFANALYGGAHFIVPAKEA